MLVDVVFVVLGVVALVLGADWLVRSASDLAIRIGVPRSVIGLTLVAWGTSAPELVVSVDASLSGQPDVAVGNVVGSNIYNIVLILGLSGLIVPLAVQGRSVRFEWPVMFGAAAALLIFGWDGTIGRFEGILFVSAMIGFTIALARLPLPTTEQEEWSDAVPEVPGGGAAWKDLALLLASIAVLGLGARGLVSGAVDIATGLGVSERVIGLSLVAVGTSLPELFTSVVAAIRKQDDIAIGNVLGSNIFNVLGILGVASLIAPIRVHPTIIAWDSLWMLGASLLLLPLMWTGLRLVRVEAAILLAIGAIYTWTLVAL